MKYTSTYAALGIAAAAIVISGCSSTTAGGTSASQQVVTQVVTSTVAASTPAPAPSTSTHAVVQQTGLATATTGGAFVMPNEVGKVLQDAQDDIQRISGNPVFFTTSTDALGAHRHQVLDDNWQVCSQNIAPGTKVNQDANIDFAVVKLDEACP